ncbi:MAG: hypothetical protein JRG94_22680 [Deltaproteobacteria bacterium]|nr:hypothetical protein [Deltaproteobacteria bacterium]
MRSRRAISKLLRPAFHKYQMMKYLGIENSAGLVHYAIKRGIVSLD